MNKLICHMTAMNNLENIISQNGMLCKNALTNIAYENIANLDVQDKRSERKVPLPPAGTLHQYVPFYFWGQTPMLLVNKDRQNDIIFLVAYTKDIENAGLSFVFTDRHAIVSYAGFSNKLDDLRNLDWKTIKSQYWRNSPEEPDRKKKNKRNFWFIKSCIGT